MVPASRGTGDLLPSDWGQHLCLELAAVDTAARLDLLSLGVIAAGLLRSWAVLCATDVFFLAAYAAATAGMLAWRRHSPASFAAWRGLPAAAMRLSVAAAPTGWVVTRQALSGAPPFTTDGGGLAAAQNAAAFALLLVFCSFGAAGSVLALARPLRLALHIPIQAATMGLIWSRNADICATPVLRHPTAQRLVAWAHRGLSLLLVLLPAGASAPQHGTAGRCQAVLTLAELLAGFLAPTMLLAAQESARFVRWQARWRRCWQREQQQRRLARQQQRAPEDSFSKRAAGAARPEEVQEQEEGEGPAGDAAGELPPHVQPPGRLAAAAYRALYAGMHPEDPSDWAMLAVTAMLLLCSAWHAILLVTPAAPAA